MANDTQIDIPTKASVLDVVAEANRLIMERIHNLVVERIAGSIGLGFPGAQVTIPARVPSETVSEFIQELRDKGWTVATTFNTKDGTFLDID